MFATRGYMRWVESGSLISPQLRSQLAGNGQYAHVPETHVYIYIYIYWCNIRAQYIYIYIVYIYIFINIIYIYTDIHIDRFVCVHIPPYQFTAEARPPFHSSFTASKARDVRPIETRKYPSSLNKYLRNCCLNTHVHRIIYIYNIYTYICTYIYIYI